MKAYECIQDYFVFFQKVKGTGSPKQDKTLAVSKGDVLKPMAGGLYGMPAGRGRVALRETTILRFPSNFKEIELDEEN